MKVEITLPDWWTGTGAFPCPWTLGSEVFRIRLKSTPSAPRLSGLGTASPAFLNLCLADSRIWSFSASTIWWTKAKSVQSCPTLWDPMNCIVSQVPLPVGFSRQEYWRELPCPPPGNLGEGNGSPLQYSCLENCVVRGAWWAAVHRVAQSRTWLRRLSVHACIGEGNGNPLRYSCLENPRDGGAWLAAIHRVTQSWTRLRWLSSSSSSSLQGIYTTQGLNPHLLHLLHWQACSLPLAPPVEVIPCNKCLLRAKHVCVYINIYFYFYFCIYPVDVLCLETVVVS